MEKIENLQKAFKDIGIESILYPVRDVSTTDGKLHRGIELILQPMMIGNNLSVTKDLIENIYDKFLKKYKKVRVIPQIHKFLNLK